MIINSIISHALRTSHTYHHFWHSNSSRQGRSPNQATPVLLHKFNMNKTFRQIFEEERQLSNSLAKHWGYRIKNTSLDSKFKRQSEGKIPTVAHINVLRLTKDIPKTERIMKIEEELRGIENGRLLAKFTEAASKREQEETTQPDEKSPVIKLMEEKVKEYNYIVQHKHLDKRFHQETRKILKLERDQTEELVEKMQSEQSKLQNANLNTQIQINKYMTQLYKSYRNKIDKNKAAVSNKGFKTKTMISEPAKSATSTVKHQEIPKLQRLGRRNPSSHKKAANTRSDKTLNIASQAINNLHYTGAQTPNPYHTNFAAFYQPDALTDRIANRGITSNQRRERIEKTIYSPFIERERLEQYKMIEKKNKSDYQALDLFKSKIHEFTNTLTTLKEKRHKRTRKTTQQQTQERSVKRREVNSSLTMNSEEKTIYNSIIKDDRQKYNQQKTIFAEILKKKHNKFNRIGVSKVLVKYDEEKAAKGLLKGDKTKKTLEETEEQNSIIKVSKLGRNSKYGSMQRNSEQAFEDSQDDQHYQRMCKNQKINLLLKHK